MVGPHPDAAAGAVARDSRAPGPNGADAGIELYWLPLGAGGRVVRWNGRVYERLAAALARRERRDLYHSALQVTAARQTWTIEMAPVWSGRGDRGVVAEGPVGSRLIGRSALFRYEVRCWRDGVIPDLSEAVGSPLQLSSDETTCHRLLAAMPSVPVLVWGRDELRAGEMWNSNSAVSWALMRAGIDARDVPLPTGGRAPGWDAGIAIAQSPTESVGARG